MKEVKAFLRPGALNGVREALRSIPDLPGITVSHVEGFGRSAPRRLADLHPFDEKVKLEVVVPDRLLEPVLRAIETAARTGRGGDGKVFVYEVVDVLKVRTGERGEKAL